MTQDIILLNKQDTMRLFAIRDRTFYSWIEKNILIPADDYEGQKRYDITRALKIKNLSPTDINSLLAKPVTIVEPEDETNRGTFPAPIEKPSVDQEVISNLKNQVEALKSQLSEERDRSKELITQMGMFENQQKLLAEIRSNEVQQFELMQKRENTLMETFQERMKELIVVSRENDTQQYDKILASLKQTQSEREQALRGFVKIGMIFIAIFFLVAVLAFMSAYYTQDQRIQGMQNDNTQYQKTLAEAQEKMKEDVKTNADRLLTLDRLHEQDKRGLEENLHKRAESEKQSLINLYGQNIKSLQSQIDVLIKEKTNIKDEKDEIRIQLQLLELKFKSILEEMTNEKKNTSAAQKEQENLRTMLLEINDSLKKLRENASAPTSTSTPSTNQSKVETAPIEITPAEAAPIKTDTENVENQE